MYLWTTWNIALIVWLCVPTSKTFVPSGVWTQKWKELSDMDSFSSMAAIVFSKKRDLLGKKGNNKSNGYWFQWQSLIDMFMFISL